MNESNFLMLIATLWLAPRVPNWLAEALGVVFAAGSVAVAIAERVAK